VAMMPLSWETQKVVWFVLATLLGLAQSARSAARPQARSALAPRAAPVVHPLARARQGALRYSRNPETDPRT
jgi:hypothetical protein